jgi:predicted nucleic acid-binding protein
MSAKFFLDTNVFVYAFDSDSTGKASKANELIRKALKDREGVISTQVVQEFLNVAIRKFRKPLTIPDCKQYLAAVLLPLCTVYPDEHLYREALDIRAETGYSFYDCLILAGADSAGCDTVFSEDLQAGRSVKNLEIVNPFVRDQ